MSLDVKTIAFWQRNRLDLMPFDKFQSWFCSMPNLFTESDDASTVKTFIYLYRLHVSFGFVVSCYYTFKNNGSFLTSACTQKGL